jgi:hypothetical protein
MDTLSRFFVQQPLHILAVALVHGLVWAALRFGLSLTPRPANAMLVPTVGWLAYAAWEWWVLVKTPEANIRIDLLLIWPLLVVLTLWAAIRAIRAWPSA